MAIVGHVSVNSTSDDCQTEDSEENESQPLLSYTKQNKECCPARWKLAYLMFLGFYMVYALRVNLSVAMVAMVNRTISDSTANVSIDVCPEHTDGQFNSTDNKETPKVQVYNWTPRTQGIILGAFFYGYIITQIPGGYLADRFGGKLLLGLGVIVTSVLTLLTPLAAELGVPYLVILRALEGFGEGVTYPAMFAMWAKWAPPLECSKLLTFSSSGGTFGTFTALPLAGLICQYCGWPYVFYIFGSASCVWCLLWFLLVSSSPETDPRISRAEREHILTSLGSKGNTVNIVHIPVISILTSLPLWAINIAHFSSSWSFYTLLTSMPLYLNDVLRFNIKENGFLSAVPYIGSWLCCILSGYIADLLRSKKIFSTARTRKLFTFIGMFIPAIFFIAVAFIGCDYKTSVLFLTLATTFGGASSAGVHINHLDIAPRYAGVTFGITNSFASIPGTAAPLLVGFLTSQDVLAGWRNIFFISAAVNVFGMLFYIVFGKGTVQDWAKEDSTALLEEEYCPCNN
ncbi:sialin-like [Protopterus annectens]|uniref:sialin-like n=1 Tax=Protopterus annectens TaxID=7888 RepID=UPI001CFB0E30|nr:sialin-like [Protopterus annectens]